VKVIDSGRGQRRGTAKVTLGLGIHLNAGLGGSLYFPGISWVRRESTTHTGGTEGLDIFQSTVMNACDDFWVSLRSPPVDTASVSSNIDCERGESEGNASDQQQEPRAWICAISLVSPQILHKKIAIITILVILSRFRRFCFTTRRSPSTCV
jgi:hypothetical protein